MSKTRTEVLNGISVEVDESVPPGIVEVVARRQASLDRLPTVEIEDEVHASNRCLVIIAGV